MIVPVKQCQSAPYFGNDKAGLGPAGLQFAVGIPVLVVMASVSSLLRLQCCICCISEKLIQTHVLAADRPILRRTNVTIISSFPKGSCCVGRHHGCICSLLTIIDSAAGICFFFWVYYKGCGYVYVDVAVPSALPGWYLPTAGPSIFIRICSVLLGTAEASLLNVDHNIVGSSSACASASLFGPCLLQISLQALTQLYGFRKL